MRRQRNHQDQRWNQTYYEAMQQGFEPHYQPMSYPNPYAQPFHPNTSHSRGRYNGQVERYASSANVDSQNFGAASNDVRMASSARSQNETRGRGRGRGQGRGGARGRHHLNQDREYQEQKPSMAPDAQPHSTAVKHQKQWSIQKIQPQQDKRNITDSVPKKKCVPFPKKNDPVSQKDTLIAQLNSRDYECMVCCYQIKREVPVWSCDACFHIFHLLCIKKWSQSLKDNTISSQSSSFEAEICSWRCPACQKDHTSYGFQYTCFCTKQTNPPFNPSHTPHSCGELCGKARGHHCVHPCNLLCHPGPCPQCEAMITRSCHCGHTTQTVRCCKAASIKCESVCSKTLNCGRHECQQTCHPDLCSSCEEVIEQKCYCGSESRSVVCGSKQSFEAAYSCNKPCGKALDCGKHNCEAVCHAGPCADCSLTPEAVTHCPCGRKSLEELTGEKNGGRSSCEDAVDTCDEVCGRELNCGPLQKPHRCLSLCHSKSCPPCKRHTELTCRCGAQRKEVACAVAREVFLCSRRCKKKRQCGNHRCGEVCCIQDEHPCPMVCGKMLKCGRHYCERMCHLGHCPSCYHQSFDELACHCGATVIYPPVACGTRPPHCRRPCTKEHACGHAPQHECHSDAVCPPCPVLVSKPCNGGHTTVNNIHCHVENVSCGRPCGQPLLCGHSCAKTCHRGECQPDDNSVCQQPCATPRIECGHPCAARCHANQPCPRATCRQQVEVICDCGHRKQTVVCASLDVMLAEMLSGDTVDLQKLAEMRKARKVPCDSNCAIIERNRKLAEALKLENADHSQSIGPTNYSRFLVDFASQYSLFAIGVENKLEDALKSVTELGQPVRNFCLDPMPTEKRRFVHELAEYYGCQSVSCNGEPHRSVTVTATRDRSKRPTQRLSTVLQAERQSSKPMVLRPPTAAAPGAPRGMQSLGKPLSRAVGSGPRPPISYADRAAHNAAVPPPPPAPSSAPLDDFDYFDLQPKT